MVEYRCCENCIQKARELANRMELYRPKTYNLEDFYIQAEKLEKGYSVDEIIEELENYKPSNSQKKEISEDGNDLADYIDKKDDEKIQEHIDDLKPKNGKNDSKKK